MIFPYEQISETELDTINIAKKFSTHINVGDIICLNGELGVGKTFFAKAVLNNFGIESANSPSFAIVNEYDGKLKFFHFDFFRLKNISELYDIGIDEYLMDDKSVKIIEWAELFADVLPNVRFEINFEMLNSEKRKITITKYE